MKKEAGVTLTILVVTVVVILLITSVTLANVKTGNEYKEYKKMCVDIEAIKDKTLIYYKDYGEIPKKGSKLIITNEEIKKLNPKGSLYEIDLEKLKNLTVNYGSNQEKDDIYIINDETLEVFYLKGIEYKGKTLYKDE